MHHTARTKEDFNVQKVVVAVNKSAYRALTKFTDEDIQFICDFVTQQAQDMHKPEIHISEMHISWNGLWIISIP